MQNASHTFSSLGLSETTLKALARKGFHTPTAIQAAAIPVLLNSHTGLIGQAQTGTGKTAAFGLPIFEKITPRGNHPQAVILVPTRELAIQVADELNSLQGDRNLSIVPVYGGQSIGLQIRSLKRGVDIMVGTPGRVLDHLSRGTMKLHQVSQVVLDEADEMLNQGFIEDIETILEAMPGEKQTTLFSATMPHRILLIARRYMGTYEHIALKPETADAELTAQSYIEVHEQDKLEALARIIDMEDDFYGLVFCRTKVDTANVAVQLQQRGYAAEALHGDISQGQRESILRSCRARKITVLVATDVAARGLDIAELTHVINYALPQDPESYMHRIGRTGRAGHSGIALTLVNPSEARRMHVYKQMLKLPLKRSKLPKAGHVASRKQERMLGAIQQIIAQNTHEEFRNIAEELLLRGSPEDVVASLLHHTKQHELCHAHYREIQRPNFSSERKPNQFHSKNRNNKFSRGKKKRFTRAS